MTIFRILLAAAALAALVGCTGGMGAAVQSLREILPKAGGAESGALDPRFEYLRVTRGRHVALLWRGSVEQSKSGRVDVYYSSAGEVVRLQNGRIVGALGLATEWRRVEIEAPSWAAAAAAPAAARVVRVRDIMPGYVTDARELLELRRTAAPSRSALAAVDAAPLAWFEERVSRSAVPDALKLAPTRYAVDLERDGGVVVYAEQCLAPDLCFTWQRWSAAMQKASAR